MSCFFQRNVNTHGEHENIIKYYEAASLNV